MIQFKYLSWLSKKKTTNPCQHSEVSRKIFNSVLIACLVAVAVTINFFHFPLYIHGIEMERFEIGLTVILILVGRTAVKNLVWALIILPFVDQLQHGHNLITIPLEICFNLFLLTVFHFISSLNKNQSNLAKWGTFWSCLFCVILAKTVYFSAILYIFIPEINLFNWNNINKVNTWNSYSVLILYLTLVVIKFSFIIGISTIFKKGRWR